MKNKLSRIVAAFVAVVIGAAMLLTLTCATSTAYGQGTFAITTIEQNQFEAQSNNWLAAQDPSGFSLRNSQGQFSSISAVWTYDYTSTWLMYYNIAQNVTAYRSNEYGDPTLNFATQPVVSQSLSGCISLAATYSGTGNGYMEISEITVNGLQISQTLVANSGKQFDGFQIDSQIPIETLLYRITTYYDMRELNAPLHSVASVTTVPEPSSLAILSLLGFLLLLCRKRS